MKGWKTKLKADKNKEFRGKKLKGGKLPFTSAYRCKVKQSFKSKSLAIEALEEYRKGKGYKNLKRVYQCNICKEYHLTKG